MPDTVKSEVGEEKLLENANNNSSDSFYKNGSFTANIQPEKQYSEPIAPTNSYRKKNDEIKLKAKKIVQTLLFIGIAIIGIIVIIYVLANYTISESEYTHKGVLWSRDITISGEEVIDLDRIELEITNNSKFTINRYEGMLIIYNDTGLITEEFSFYGNTRIGPSTSRKVEDTLFGHLPKKDYAKWDYTIELKGTVFD